MSEMAEPPRTLRGLFGTTTVCLACVVATVLMAVGGFLTFVVLSLWREGESGSVAFAVTEFAPVLLALGLLGTLAVLASYGATLLARRARRSSTRTPLQR